MSENPTDWGQLWPEESPRTPAEQASGRHSGTKLVSPDELMAAAKLRMLEGREPKSTRDWYLIVNFFAANIDPDVVRACMPLMKVLYDIPMMDEEMTLVIDYQLNLKA